ncbi:zinc transporter, putative [Bodo saltans]|uniref:Zinc transporter, putative n=1 Tax=Bodo saltans TaxID=75058 RepID=A0A0S4JVV5_BODSA|nr:zinc transporter, putative [Bodo saltans]|eukprot:CUG94369.1 zinc transporter, putative [Bodo saltans]
MSTPQNVSMTSFNGALGKQGERSRLIINAESDDDHRDHRHRTLSPTRSPCTMAPAESAATQRTRRALTGAICFCFVFMIAEFVGGFYTHSLAVLNDAAHMITDVASLSLSLMAVHASSWKSCTRYSYGWRRAEVVGALASVFATWALVIWILIEAGLRLITLINCAGYNESDPSDCFAIDAPVMLGIGCAGLVSNIMCAAVLHWGGHHGHSHGEFGEGANGEHDDDHHGHSHDDHGHSHDDHGHSHDDHSGHDHGGHDHGCSHDEDDDHHGHSGHGHENMNLRGAFLHVIGDCLQSIGVIFSAAVIWGTNESVHHDSSSARSYANIADPLCSVFFGVITIFTTRNLFRDIFRVLMECTPKGVSSEKLQKSLGDLQQVEEVSDFHVWSLGSEGAVLSAHLALAVGTTVDQAKRVLKDAEGICKRAGVGHTTIQLNYAASIEDSGHHHDDGEDCSHGHSHGCGGHHH